MKTEKHYPEEWTNPSGKKMLTCICGNRLPCPHEKQQSAPRKTTSKGAGALTTRLSVQTKPKELSE